MLFLMLLGLLAFSHATENCELDDWGAWEPCFTRHACLKKPNLDISWEIPFDPEHGGARQRMGESMRHKERQMMSLANCRRDGTCPERAVRPSTGFAACIDGVAENFWPCHNVDLMSHTNINDLGYDWLSVGDLAPNGNDVWAWTDQDSTEYVLMGVSGGTSFVRIANPSDPEVLGFLYSTAYTPSQWRDIKTKGNYAYIVSEAPGHGMQIFDLTRLRTLGHDPTRELFADAHYGVGVLGRSHNIVGNDDSDHVYIVGARDEGAGATPLHCSGGLHIVDVSDPLNPTFAGCYDSDGYSHDAECVQYDGPDQNYQGREICFGYNENSLTVVDVTNKLDMVMLSRTTYAGSQYTHQGWLTEDKSIILMDDELDEQRGPSPFTRTLIWDVSDLTLPVLVNSYYSVYPSTDHNQYIKGDYVYQSNYKAGLQMLRIDAVNYDLNWVAEFDVLPTEMDTGFGGTWSNYPYLASGIVPVSSMEHGLFLVRPDMAAIESELMTGRTPSIKQRYRTILGGDVTTCPKSFERRQCHDPVNVC